MAKKHYRAFKKQLEISSPKGVFIPNSQKEKLIIISIIVLVLVFIKGILLGSLLSKNK